MENRKIIEFENKFGLSSTEAISMIKKFIATELTELTLLDDYNNSTGHWGIKYMFKDLKVVIQSDFGDLNVFILYNSKEIALREIDEFMANIIITSKKNIEYMLLALRRLMKAYLLLCK